MNVAIDIRGGNKSWDTAAIERLALFTLEYMDVPQSSEVSVSLVSVDEIHELNREYRGIDRPTDVLSFECDSPWDDYAEDEVVEIGDVVIAPDIVDEQRARFGTSFEEEASLMLVHSLLHLLGYDHIEEDEALEMEGLEKEILDAYGLTGIRP